MSPALDITIDRVTVSPRRRTAYLDGVDIDLTAREFSLLYFLMDKAGRIVSREELAGEVWKDERALQSNTIDVSICHLREKIGDDRRKIISSIRGVGYFYAMQ
ncbi:MAG: winged helix-turn-helix domain-containing protein [Actinomycetia bacterium]|nr:winged helix-turn-helix domain-containing protein [Actinomycetes bacterium]